MAVTAYEYAVGRTVVEDGGATGWFARRRIARLEHRLVPAEARFFDAYCRGGSHVHHDLAIDYDFVARPRVRELLREGAAGRRLRFEELEAEYFLADANPNLAAFRANLTHLAACIRGDA